MEATMVCWGYIGIMEKKMEITAVSWQPDFVFRSVGVGPRGFCRDAPFLFVFGFLV